MKWITRLLARWTKPKPICSICKQVPAEIMDPSGKGGWCRECDLLD